MSSSSDSSKKRKIDSKYAPKPEDVEEFESFEHVRKFTKWDDSYSSSSSSSHDVDMTNHQLHLKDCALVTLLTDQMKLCAGASWKRHDEGGLEVTRDDKCTISIGHPLSHDGMVFLAPAALNRGLYEELTHTKAFSLQCNIVSNGSTVLNGTECPTIWNGTWLPAKSSPESDGKARIPMLFGNVGGHDAHLQTFDSVDNDLHARYRAQRELTKLKQFSEALVKLMVEYMPRVQEPWVGRTVLRYMSAMAQSIPYITPPRFREVHLSDMTQLDLYSGDAQLFHPDGVLFTVNHAAILRFLGGTFTMPIRVSANGRTQVFLSDANVDTMHIEMSQAAVLHARSLSGNLLIVTASDESRILVNTMNVTSRFKLEPSYICEHLATVHEDGQEQQYQQSSSSSLSSMY
jgi:hypothetical protein